MRDPSVETGLLRSHTNLRGLAGDYKGNCPPGALSLITASPIAVFYSHFSVYYRWKSSILHIFTYSLIIDWLIWWIFEIYVLFKTLNQNAKPIWYNLMINSNDLIDLIDSFDLIDSIIEIDLMISLVDWIYLRFLKHHFKRILLSNE